MDFGGAAMGGAGDAGGFDFMSWYVHRFLSISSHIL